MINTEVLRMRNTPKVHSAVQSAIHTLRDAGIAVEHVGVDHLRIDGRISFWVFTKLWKADDGSATGYGITSLIAAVRSK